MSQNKLHVRKGDTVVVSGDKGKRASAYPSAEQQVVVEGVNIVSKHHGPVLAGWYRQQEAPIYAAVMLVCPACRSRRIAKKELENGKQVRVCRHYSETIDK